MIETNNIESSFRLFLNRLNQDHLTQTEAHMILVLSEQFYGFLNVLFDYHISVEELLKVADEVESPANEATRMENLLQKISKTETKKPKVIKMSQSLLYNKDRRPFTQSAREGPFSGKSNLIPSRMYRNHFLCSLLSDLLIDLFMPQKCRHSLKFQKGWCFDPLYM